MRFNHRVIVKHLNPHRAHFIDCITILLNLKLTALVNRWPQCTVTHGGWEEGQGRVTLFPKLIFYTLTQHHPEGYLTLPSCLSSDGNYQPNRRLKNQVG